MLLKLETIDNEKRFFEVEESVKVHNIDKFTEWMENDSKHLGLYYGYQHDGTGPDTGILIEYESNGTTKFLATNGPAFLMNDNGKTVEVLNK